MLHILWMIIKILLIILACVIGLLLAVILLILFCPIRYYACLDKAPDTPIKEYQAMAKFSWLFHIFTFRMDYFDGKKIYVMRFLGIPINKLIRKKMRKKSKTADKDTESKQTDRKADESDFAEASDTVAADTSEQISDIVSEELSEESSEESSDTAEDDGTIGSETENPEIEPNDLERDLAENSLTEKSQIEKEYIEKDQIEDQIEEDYIEKDQIEENEIEEKTESSGFQIRKILSLIRKISLLPINLIKKLVSIWKAIFRKIRGVKHKTDSVKRKMTWYKRFLTHPKTKAAVSLVWKDGKTLILHILPRKIKGNIVFDSENPSLTGTVLAVAGMTIPVHKNKIKITPLFENKNYLEGYMKLKGKVYGFVLLIIIIEIYYNRSIRFVLAKWKNRA